MRRKTSNGRISTGDHPGDQADQERTEHEPSNTSLRPNSLSWCRQERQARLSQAGASWSSTILASFFGATSV